VKIIDEEEFLKLLEPYVNVDILRRGEHITEFRPEELIKGWKPVGEGEKKEETKRGKTLFDLLKDKKKG